MHSASISLYITCFTCFCITWFLFQEPHHLPAGRVHGFLKISASFPLSLHCGQRMSELRYLPSDAVFHKIKASFLALHTAFSLHCLFWGSGTFRKEAFFSASSVVFAHTGPSRYTWVSYPGESFCWPQGALIAPLLTLGALFLWEVFSLEEAAHLLALRTHYPQIRS